MALIGRIRNNLWLVIVLLGLAMLGFIFMDMTRNDGSSLFGGSATDMGKIDGQKVDYLEFDRLMRLRYNSSAADQYTLRNSLWNTRINEIIVNNEGEKLGLSIPESEMEGLIYGPNYSPIIMQDFSRPGAYGQVDTEQLNQIRDLESTNKLNPEYKPFWEEEKNRVKQDRMQSKLMNLVSKSIYTPTWLAKMKHNDINGIAQLAFVQVPFDQIPNAEVALEDADYEKYLKENASLYTRDVPQQTIGYVTFDVKPTAADSALWRSELDTLIPQFRAEEEVQIFVESNQGIYEENYTFKDGLNPDVADDIFDAEVGTIYGPYIDGDTYKVAKLLDRKIIPDSVSASHILRTTEANNPLSLAAARDTINMIKELVESGQITFDSLAAKYSQDPSNKDDGGDLGTFGPGRMVQPFNDACFYQSKPGDLKVVETQFGVHLILIVGHDTKSKKKGVKVAYLQKPIVPTKETSKKVYAKALRFASDHPTLADLKKAATNADLSFETSAPLDENGFNIEGLGSGESTRNIVKWANDANVGDVSPTVYRYTDKVRFYENKYVVATLASKDKAGLPSVSSIKKTIGTLVMNEKKGTMLAEQLNGMSDLTAIADKYSGVAVDSVNTPFRGTVHKNAQLDPKLIAAAFQLDNGQTSQPVVGENGVYVVTMIQKPTPSEPTDIPSLRSQVSSALKTNARSLLLPAMKKEVSIEDDRKKFY